MNVSITTESVLLFAGTRGLPAIFLLVAIPLVTFIVSWMHGVYDGRRPPWRHIYGLVVHLVTMSLVTLGALIAIHIVGGGSWQDAVVPRQAVYSLAGCWVFSLLAVKRAVDFQHIPSVRNPILLLLAWSIGWTAGAALYQSGLWLIPGPPLYTAGAAALLIFLIFQMILGSLGTRR